jgi:hypothetical protein
MNQRVTFSAKDEDLDKVLDGMLKRNSLGFVVLSKAGDRYDGWLLIKQGNERGYAASEESKAKGVSKPATKDKDKGAAKSTPRCGRTRVRPA